MDTSGVAITRWKKGKTINDGLCVICQSTSKTYSVVKQPKLESLNKLLESCKVRHENHDSTVTDLFDIFGTITAPEFIEKHFIYHRECYNRLTNIKTIEQVVKWYGAAIQTPSLNVISRTPGRPLSNQSNKLTEEVQLTPNRRSFYLRLNAIPNAADARYVRYHWKCWVKMQRLIDPKKNLQELDDFKQVACDTEIISFIKHQFSNPAGLIMDMNTMNESYKKKLKEFEVEECKIKNNNKPYIK